MSSMPTPESVGSKPDPSPTSNPIVNPSLSSTSPAASNTRIMHSGNHNATRPYSLQPDQTSRYSQYSFTASTELSSQSTVEAPKNSQDYMKEIGEITKKNEGQFEASDVYWASSASDVFDNVIWKCAPTLKILPTGKLTTPSIIIIEKLHYSQIKLHRNDTIVEIQPWKENKRDHVKFLFRFNNDDDYIRFISALIIWSNLKPSGILSKWSYDNDDSKIRHRELKLEAKVKLHPVTSEEDSRPHWTVTTIQLSKMGIFTITDSDNTVVLSIDATKLFDFEVRRLHESVCGHPSVLFIGAIEELRKHHNVKNCNIDNSNVYVMFDALHELQKWMNNLHSFTQHELLRSTSGINTDLDPIKLSQRLKLEIMEVQIPRVETRDLLYCELFLWDHIWFKSSVVRVDDLKCAFWKELVDLDLPIGDLNHIKVLVKRVSSPSEVDYNASYEVINMYGEGEGVSEHGRDDEILGACFLDCKSFQNDHILKRIPVTTLQNTEIGNLMINLTASQSYVLPNGKYKALEKLLSNTEIDDVLSYIHPYCDTTQTEEVACTLLDAYDCLGMGDQYFSALMKFELAGCQGMKSEYSSRSLDSTKGKDSTLQGQPLRFNTIFRGNSILSKSLERYTLSKGQEYICQLLSPFIDQIITENLNCECDPKLSPESYEENYQHLLSYVETLWDRINSSTNDIPLEIKQQWKNLRVNVEFEADINDTETPLNALSSFIFLRFICPAIMTPKLYGISISATEGLSGRITRTLMLVSKVMMVFSNRGKFQNHKDPHLMRLNDEFLSTHAEEMSAFYDKVTQRKMDFNERVLNVEESTKANTTIDDKSLKFARFANMICKYFYEKHGGGGTGIGSEEENDGLLEVATISDEEATGTGYQIVGFDDSLLEGNDFITSLMNEDSEAFGTLMDKNLFTIKDVEKQCVYLHEKCERIVRALEREEYLEDGDYQAFTTAILDSMRVSDGIIVYQGFGEDVNDTIKRILTEAVNTREKERVRERAQELERAKWRLRNTERERKVAHGTGSHLNESNNHGSNGHSEGGKRSLFRSIFKRKSTITPNGV